jgi:hypothetical protein
LFDAREEILSSVPTWIKLPNSPLEFWLDSSLKAIGEVLGKFIVVDDNYKTSNMRLMAQILVDLDPHQGLFVSMELVMGDCNYTQHLDYVNIPFQCSKCHQVGHAMVDCDRSFQNKISGLA